MAESIPPTPEFFQRAKELLDSIPIPDEGYVWVDGEVRRYKLDVGWEDMVNTYVEGRRKNYE